MSRLIFAALLTSLATAPLAAQEVPGRDLLEFPLGALAEPRPLASSVLGALWNPARSAGPMQPRLELGFGALTTPIEQGVDGRAIAAAGRLPMGFSASLMYAALDVSDILRTATDPQTLGEIPYRTSVTSLGIARRFEAVTIGLAARRRASVVDRRREGVWGADAGVLIDGPERIPLRVGVSTLMLVASNEDEPRTWMLGAELPVFRRDSTARAGVGYALTTTQRRGHEAHWFATGTYRFADARVGLVRDSRFGTVRNGVRAGVGLRYARYRIGIAREDGGAGLGASYQFLLTSVFP